MAKRANPYMEDYIPQSKVHVGLKQFNNNEYRLKDVYEKTLDKLYKGAKKVTSSDIVNACDTQTIRKDKMKQLFLGKDGSLLHSGNIVENKPEAKLCSCGGNSEGQCSYCEKALCVNCQHSCSLCSLTHCSQCMLMGSESSEVCVSCYG
ncbi:apoptosis regulatory protein Siva-like [Manduca sexta]|nr:apoptosis regulatory protein Siva-like [Manduca sexta]